MIWKYWEECLGVVFKFLREMMNFEKSLRAIIWRCYFMVNMEFSSRGWHCICSLGVGQERESVWLGGGDCMWCEVKQENCSSPTLPVHGRGDDSLKFFWLTSMTWGLGWEDNPRNYPQLMSIMQGEREGENDPADYVWPHSHIEKCQIFFQFLNLNCPEDPL